MKVLLITNLYPNSLQPARGIFTAQKVVGLKGRCEFKVIAPIASLPYWPGRSGVSAIPLHEQLDGIEVWHPRARYVPVVWRRHNAALYAASIRWLVHELHQQHRFDLIWATWGFPDVVAAVKLAQELKLPVIASLHGTDVNYGFRVKWCRNAVVQALHYCKAVGARSNVMRRALLRQGLEPGRVFCIHNGVDLQRFHLTDRTKACARLGWDPQRKRLLFVGNLVPVKNVSALLEAFAALTAGGQHPELELIIIGDGSERERLKQLARTLDVDKRTQFLGIRRHVELPVYYNAADCLCLSSLNEGLPNVVLEALACGLPVVATAVGGVPEVIDSPALGLLTEPGDTAGLTDALGKALKRTWNRSSIAQIATRFDQKRNMEATYELLQYAAGQRAYPPVLSLTQTGTTVPRPRVLLLSRLYPTPMDQTNGCFNEELALSLQHQCDVEVVAPVSSVIKESPFDADTKSSVVPVRYPAYWGIRGLNRITAGFSLLNATRRLPVRADVLLASSVWPDGYAVARLGQRLLIPAIIQVIGSDIDLLPQSGLRRIQTLWALHQCQHVYSVSGRLRDKMVELGIPSNKITVIYNGIDPKKFHVGNQTEARRQLGLPLDRKIILFVGRIGHHKGVDTLLQAVARLSGNPLLVMIGNDVSDGQMQAMARSLGIMASCQFIATQPHPAICAWMNAADLFAFPSLHEGCPNVILEALACGLPVVATDVGGIPEIVAPLLMPWTALVPPDHPELLASALEKMLAQKWSRQSISSARPRTWDNVGQDVYQLIQSVTKMDETPTRPIEHEAVYAG